MKQKYWLEFPSTAGQWAGRHWFFTKKERATFIGKHGPLGAPIAEASQGKI